VQRPDVSKQNDATDVFWHATFDMFGTLFIGAVNEQQNLLGTSVNRRRRRTT
jgi:hypothetical protein